MNYFSVNVSVNGRHLFITKETIDIDVFKQTVECFNARGLTPNLST